MSARKHLQDLIFACGLLLLLVLFFWPATVGDRTLLPADALYQWQPWQAHAPSGGPQVPHNSLVTDLVLQNNVWKQFVLQSLRARELPLWNPYILSGVPFLAAGQHSALYPFSLIFYVFPLARAYGLFTVSQLLLAGLSLYFYARTIRLSRLAATVGGLIFAFSGFLQVSTVFPMVIAVAAWLPFLLAVTERLLQAASEPRDRPWRERLQAPLPWLILGSLALGLQFLAGHVEIFYYNLLVVGAYAVWRAVAELWPRRRWRALVYFGSAFAVMLALGLALGAVQVLPLYELVTQNFRQDSATYHEIIGWAYRPRHLLAFLIPDFYGNPVHHSYVDFFSGQTVTDLRNAGGQSINTIFWGIKDYVEGGAYVSLLALFLALLGVVRRPRSQALFFLVVGLFSLSLAFGLPTYRLVYALPGIKQLHSPFRWVFPYTVCLAVLAAMGAQALAESAEARRRWRLPTALGGLAMVAAAAILGGLALIRAFPERVLPLADRLVARLAKAPEAFADGRAFLSYEARNLWIFALCLLGAGLALVAARWAFGRQRTARQAAVALVCQAALLAVLVLDPAAWFRHFMPAVDPAPLELRPSVVEFLQQDPEPFRITAYDTQDRKPLPANTNMLFGLYDVRGYDSIIPKWYAEVMSLVGPQELEYNQIARLTRPESLDSPILDLLNVRYVLTEETIDRPHYALVHDSEMRVYRNDDTLPRAYVTFQAQIFPDRASLLEALPQADPGQAVLLEEAPPAPKPLDAPAGDILFRVTGDVSLPNAGQACAVDAANIAPFLRDHTVDDPLTGKSERYRGILLSDLWRHCGAVNATQAILTADSGRRVTIAKDDLIRQPILVVTQAGRKALAAEQGGPAKLAFPPAISAGYPPEAWLKGIEAIEFGGPAATPPVAPEVEFLENSAIQVQLRVDMPVPGYLVLADTYFPGWVAHTRPEGQAEEQALTILRAYGTVRAVQLPAGPQTVRFKYSPDSVKTGAFVSFMAGVSLLLLAGAWLWARAYSPPTEEQAAQRIAKNTVIPLGLQLLNRGIDMVFAMLMLRLLGHEGAGKYAIAVYVAVLLEVVTNFGLNTLLTREVARNRQEANGYLWNTSILRLGLALLAAPLLVLFLLLYHPPADTSMAIILLAIGLVPSSISAGLSAVFMAFEVMVIPAVVSVVTTLLKVGLGAGVLLLGGGFIGLAGTSIAVNTVTMVILLGLLIALFFRPHPQARPKLQRQMALEAYPLMFNHLLATLFFKVDYFLLDRMWGSAVVGWYSVSYKFVDAVGIIPPTFTMALFPLMSRFANSSRDSLYRAYILAIKLLFSLGLLVALLSTALAYPLITIIGGGAYLPHSAIALQIIVWYMPLGFINSVTQYMLIALDQQRYVTKAFVVGLGCSLGANLLLIPRFGYSAAAAVHILAEVALLVPFYLGVRRYLAPVPWLGVLWRPLASAGVAGGLFWLLRSQPRPLVGVLATGVYLGLLIVLGTFDAPDQALLRQVIPLDRLWLRLQKRFSARTT